jgi:hypothetical protein
MKLLGDSPKVLVLTIVFTVIFSVIGGGVIWGRLILDKLAYGENIFTLEFFAWTAAAILFWLVISLLALAGFRGLKSGGLSVTLHNALLLFLGAVLLVLFSVHALQSFDKGMMGEVAAGVFMALGGLYFIALGIRGFMTKTKGVKEGVGETPGEPF